VETLVYRTVAEALSNVRRHARAGRVDVRVRNRRDAITGTIRDDGCGFDGAAEGWRQEVSLHFGLQEAAERLRMAGGVLEVDSAAGSGTRVRFEVPRR
jgi:signal transduction histidine kinase